VGLAKSATWWRRCQNWSMLSGHGCIGREPLQPRLISCIDLGGPGVQDEATPSLPIPPVAHLGCCWVPVPTPGPPVVGVLVPAPRIVLLGLGRTAGRTRTEGDRVTLYRRVQRFTPLLIEVAQACRHRVGRNWFVDET